MARTKKLVVGMAKIKRWVNKTELSRVAEENGYKTIEFSLDCGTCRVLVNALVKFDDELGWITHPKLEPVIARLSDGKPKRSLYISRLVNQVDRILVEIVEGWGGSYWA